jgi:hypothetical protein
MENLAKALVAFQKELPKVGKDKTATVPTKAGGSYKYTYADLGSLTHTVLPLLNKHGLSWVTFGRITEGGGYELVGMLLHTSGESLTGALPIYGRQPQEIGSAVTYNRRYLLGCMTGVVTEDDDDGKAAVKATRTQAEPAKEWDVIADTAEMMSTVEDLKALWIQEEVGKAPKAIQDRIKAHGDTLKAESE